MKRVRYFRQYSYRTVIVLLTLFLLFVAAACLQYSRGW
jgi:hypothetical protein